MRLTREAIARLIPHAGDMVLLDGILDWDGDGLRATARSHRARGNPLRRGDRLPILAGIEYAAQATAAHGALLAAADAGATPRPGYLALVRDVRWRRDRLDTVTGALDIHVRRVSLQRDGALYDFQLQSGGERLIEGRLAVIFPEDASP